MKNFDDFLSKLDFDNVQAVATEMMEKYKNERPHEELSVRDYYFGAFLETLRQYHEWSGK